MFPGHITAWLFFVVSTTKKGFMSAEEVTTRAMRAPMEVLKNGFQNH
jgi:hypothetical protein